MARPKKLSDVDIIYINAKRETVDIATIAKALGRSTKSIQKYVDEHPVVKAEPLVVDNPPEPLKPEFIHKTMGGNPGVTILTRQASELADAMKNNGRTNKYNDCVQKAKKS